jgi:hypothetical protein
VKVKKATHHFPVINKSFIAKKNVAFDHEALELAGQDMSKNRSTERF